MYCKKVRENDFPKQVPEFKSLYSLDKIYPKSSLDWTVTPTLEVSSPDKFNGYIPVEKLSVTYARSSGPGGQHVNKTNSKVRVTFHLESAEWIPEKTRMELAKLHRNSINKDGLWSVTSEKTRMQTLNLADCLDKIRCYITEATIDVEVPSIETLEMKRKRAEKAAAQRLRDKKLHSLRKQDKIL
jgi:peptidyl-tRNA hydrolase ICT1